MKRTKCRMQVTVDKGTQGGNTRALNYTHPLDTDVREGRGDRNSQNLRRESPAILNHTQPWDTDVRNTMADRVFGGNLHGF